MKHIVRVHEKEIVIQIDRHSTIGQNLYLWISFTWAVGRDMFVQQMLLACEELLEPTLFGHQNVFRMVRRQIKDFIQEFILGGEEDMLKLLFPVPEECLLARNYLISSSWNHQQLEEYVRITGVLPPESCKQFPRDALEHAHAMSHLGRTAQEVHATLESLIFTQRLHL